MRRKLLTGAVKSSAKLLEEKARARFRLPRPSKWDEMLRASQSPSGVSGSEDKESYYMIRAVSVRASDQYIQVRPERERQIMARRAFSTAGGPPLSGMDSCIIAEKEERKSVIPEESQKRLKEGWEVIKEVLHDEDDLNEITINETAVEAKMKKA